MVIQVTTSIITLCVMGCYQMTRATSVITVCVSQVARCGDQSAYLCYNCMFKFRKQGVVRRMHRPFFVIFIVNFNTETGNIDTESLFSV